MTPSTSSFPWFFFWKIARLQAGVTAALFLGLAVWDFEIALSVLPFILVASLVFMACFGVLSRPLRTILERVAAIVHADLPYDQQLNLFYQRNEWAQIDAALNDAARKQLTQLQTIQAENRKFTTLLASISNEILAVDRHTNVLFYNPRFSRNFLSGKEKLQEGGKLWSVLEVPEAVALFENVLRDPQPQKLKGFPLSVQNEVRYYNLTVTPLPDANGTVNGAVGVFTDVTDAKKTEQMRVDFVANVSHEIRSPLTSIKGFTQILKAGQAQVPAELHPFLDKILHNTERMIALFNDLLNLSVIESRDRMSPEEVQLADILDQVEDTVATLFPGKSFELKRDLQRPTAFVDAKLFEHVLINLMENACKYAGENPVVTVGSRLLGQDLEITLSDNGPGIAKEHLGRIFERFYRVDSSRERGTGGTGLGLAIVKHIIVKHHGTIRAESDGQHGTTFIITLPQS